MRLSIAVETDAASQTGQRNPPSGVMRSRQPRTSEAITGREAAIASMTARGSPSVLEGCRYKSAAHISAGISFRNPRKRT